MVETEQCCETIFKDTTKATNLKLRRKIASMIWSANSNAILFCIKVTRNLRPNYVDLHYMIISKKRKNNSFEYFLLHVITESSITTKLRVVFDASAPTTSGLSLNNIQPIGPVLQDDLLSIILRFPTLLDYLDKY